MIITKISIIINTKIIFNRLIKSISLPIFLKTLSHVPKKRGF